MPRADLLALSFDDLVTLTNRGTVKRAQREIDEKEVAGDLAETPEGDVSVRWADGPECRLPAGVTLREGQCSCAAVGLCRHLVRAVLLYQRQVAVPAAVESWDPGGIPDEELQRHYRPVQLTKAREQLEQGLLVELVRGTKPSARFHLQACLLRFLVPGDVRYTHCDCGEAAPCSHVPLAVWAFRRLDPGQKAGILSTSTRALPAPVEVLDRVDSALEEYAVQGVSGVPPAWKDRLVRLEKECEDADLVWPAELLGELIEQQEQYTSHDARFAPDVVVELTGELLARCDAIRHDTGALPQLLIRGTSADRATTIGTTSFVGLGCGVRAGRKRVTLTAYLQERDSGTVMAVCREVADPDVAPNEPLPFADLAHASAAKGVSCAALGVGLLNLHGGKRTARCHLVLSRAGAGLQEQKFAWEELRAPVLVEEFAELQDRLGALPPACLRPRRVAEDFHVCRVAGVEGVRFDPVTQTVRAVLLDARRQSAALVFPYLSRGRAGAEALLARLTEVPDKLLFVSGPVRRGASGLVIEPVCLVFQQGAGRVALQPWIDVGQSAGVASPSAPAAGPGDPLLESLQALQSALEEMLVLGLQRADAQAARRWRELQQLAESIGLVRLSVPLRQLADALESKAHDLRWGARPAAGAFLRVAVLLRLALDMTG